MEGNGEIHFNKHIKLPILCIMDFSYQREGKETYQQLHFIPQNHSEDSNPSTDKKLKIFFYTINDKNSKSTHLTDEKPKNK